MNTTINLVPEYDSDSDSDPLESLASLRQEKDRDAGDQGNTSYTGTPRIPASVSREKQKGAADQDSSSSMDLPKLSASATRGKQKAAI